MTPQQAGQLAKKYSADPSIRVAGVTKDNCVVTTQDCVDYRRKIDDLKSVYRNGKKIKYIP